MTHDELQAALDAATATLASGQCDEYSARHARDVLALAACVSALRDVLSQTERERDEARALSDAAGRALTVLREAHLRESAAWCDADLATLCGRLPRG